MSTATPDLAAKPLEQVAYEAHNRRNPEARDWADTTPFERQHWIRVVGAVESALRDRAALANGSRM